MRTILVVGFGPFLDVADNPSARLAREVDGVVLPGLRVIGREMPVSYGRAPALSVWLAEQLDASVVLGIGVARGRPAAQLERTGRRHGGTDSPDMDGEWATDLDPAGPPEVQATIDVRGLAEALGVDISEDAGRYVCNAWLYRAVRLMPRRREVGFLHLPDEGLPAERLVRGLALRWGHRTDGGAAP